MTISDSVLLGAEAVGLGALHAGVSLAYGYPGTPSTEIIEYMQGAIERGDSGITLQTGEPKPRASWCSNEKTAYEAAVGASAVNSRVLVTMKHVGLNVAADPFMNSVLARIQGGLVLAVADDPGMHSSQNEQDSRWFADFARIPCLEPRSQQEAYDMTRLAFDLSERHRVPVMLRLVTRLAHSRATVHPAAARAGNAVKKFAQRGDFMVLPAIARKNWKTHLGLYATFEAESDASDLNPLMLAPGKNDPEARRAKPFAVITSGLGRNYYEENMADLGFVPDHLHLGLYPLPVEKIRALAAGASRILCIEEGYPYAERFLRGMLPGGLKVSGKLDGTIEPAGELTPDSVREGLSLAPLPRLHAVPDFALPDRPPQLCRGCPHGDTFNALNDALSGYPESLVTSDIGCYSIGYLPPYKAIETSLCMGASIPMARGAADSGYGPVVAVLGDGTFMHSGLTGLADAISARAPVTVIILDNLTTGMTGGQDTVLDSSTLGKLVLGLGVEPEHCVGIVPLPKNRDENAKKIRDELAYQGVSVILARRECVQTMARKNRLQKEAV